MKRASTELMSEAAPVCTPHVSGEETYVPMSFALEPRCRSVTMPSVRMTATSISSSRSAYASGVAQQAMNRSENAGQEERTRHTHDTHA